MKQSKTILPILVFALFAVFLVCSDRVQKATSEALYFCGTVLVPSLFPGFVLSDMLIGFSGKNRVKKDGWFSRVFHLPPSCFRCWFLGLLAGFPTAADCVCRMVQTGEISKSDGEKCLAFTNNPGIVFIICAVGNGLFGSFVLGLYLWLIQTVTAFLVGIFLAEPGPTSSISLSETKNIDWKRLFPKSVVSSVASVLNICGFVVFFRVIIDLITGKIFTPVKIFFAGLLEMTCGISLLPDISFFSLVLASFLLGWSGLSVHFQILNVISSADLSVRRYFPGKVLQAVLSALFTGASCPFLLEESPRYPVILFAVLAIFFIFIYRLRKEYLCGKRNLSTRTSTP